MIIDRQEALRRLNSSRNFARASSVEPVANPHSDANLSATSESAASSPPCPRDEESVPNAHVSFVVKGRGGRGNSPNTPEFMRQIIGDTARNSPQSQAEIGRQFGVEQNTVSTYETGKVGSRPATAERANRIREHQEAIKDTALTKLMDCLGLLTIDKLVDLKASEISRVAANMSKVAANIEERSSAVPVNITIYTPQPRSEAKYKVVDVD